MLESASPPPSTSNSTSREEPLPPLRHGLFLLGATLLIAAFYGFCVLSLLICSTVWVAALVISVLGAQYGGLRTMRPYLDSLASAIMAFARGLRLLRGAEFRVAVSREEAPQLWAQVEAFSRDLGVAPPREVVLEDGVNAWVRLSGVASGRGKSQLGVGFDLLVGLTPAQARAVMAHEIAHAKHVRRGYHGFLSRGLARLRRCSASLRQMAADPRQRKISRNLSKVLGIIPQKLGDVTGRLVAVCSRYDEFLADRVAAQLCGSKASREALLAIHVLAHQSDDVSWRERLLHLDRTPGYTTWLLERLDVPDDTRRLEIEARALSHAHRHEMSTHPALPDRLAALDELASTAEIALPGEPQSAIFWLREPDVTAAKLLHEIERVAAQEEAKATQSLSKWMRKQTRGYAARSRHNLWVGVSCLFFGALYFLVTFWDDLDIFDHIMSWNSLGFLVLMMAGTYFLLEPRRPQVEFPIPSFGAYCAALNQVREENRKQRQEVQHWKELPPNERIALEVAQVQREEEENSKRGRQFRTQLLPETVKPRAIAHFWNGRAAELLRGCNYRDAAQCVRLALESDQKNPDALFLYSISHAFQNKTIAQESLQTAFAARTDSSARWMMAWANCLCGETGAGEAFLLDLTRQNSRDATLWSLLAWCQGSNDKPREALASYRHAFGLVQGNELKDEAEEDAHRFVLAQMLAGLGQLVEAKEHFVWLDTARQKRPLLGVDAFRLSTELLRLELSGEDLPLALARAENIATRSEEPRYQMQLAEALRESRHAAAQQAARGHFERALETGFYPQALLSLSKIALDAGDKTVARQLLFEALDTSRPRALDAVHPLSILKAALAQLRALRDAPPCQVKAFEVHFNARGTTLDVEKLSLWCLFATEETAREEAISMLEALWPQQDLAGRVSCESDPKESQPDGLVAPGIYRSQWK